MILPNSDVAVTDYKLNTKRHRSKKFHVKITSLYFTPPPPILTSSLTSKIGCVRKKSFPTKSFWNILIVAAASLLISYLLGQNVNATIYNVGTSGQTDYATLEELRDDVTTWYDDDEIILHNDDGSLEAAFDFGDAKIKISGNAKVSPNGTNFPFSTTSSNTNLTIANGSSINFDGFNNTNKGGAIQIGSGNIEISGTSTFTENTAGDSGGAILSYGNVEISGTSTFTENSATYGNGGAIYSNGNVKISGTSTFTENSATYGNGGAIYSNGNITITASTGDIVFEGNKASGNPNAIHMYNDGNKILSLAAMSGNSVKFYDPIKSYSSNPDYLTIKINEGGEIGTVLFDMSNNGTYKTSEIDGNTTVYNGTLALKGEAVYGTLGNTGTFKLEDNATLLVTGKDNTINSSGTVTLAGTLAFDLTGVTTSDKLLNFNGTTSGTAISKVDIRVFNGNGNFALAKTSDTFQLDVSLILTTHGEPIDKTRANGNVSLALADTNKTLQLTSSVTKEIVTWTGNANNIWNATKENWENGGSTVTQFLHGDDVIFSDSSDESHNITIQDGGVTIGNTITFADKGTWTFTGGEIEGGTIIVAQNADTKIYFDTRQMNQRIELATSANATIAATQGETLTFKGLNSTEGGAISAGDNSSNFTIGKEGSSIAFDANSAYKGGAISSYGYVTISGTSTFTQNSVNGEGGAIYSYGNVEISGTNTFTKNSATYGGGGAILSNGNVEISGTSTFTDNSAYYGGAIYSGGDVKITASTGDIVFTGNKANNSPNAIYIENYNSDSTLSLSATSGNNVKFYDPIESYDPDPDLLTIEINKDDQTGTVLFDMSNHTGVDKMSEINGSTTVYNGTFALKGEAVYGAGGNTGTFTLKNNATLLTTGIGQKYLHIFLSISIRCEV
jgi:predicted outer membrane repeat protein